MENFEKKMECISWMLIGSMILTFVIVTILYFKFYPLYPVLTFSLYMAFCWGLPVIVRNYLSEYKISMFLFRKNEIKIIENGEKDFIYRYLSRGGELSETGQKKLVELAKNSEKHREILSEGWGFVMCYDAAEMLVEEQFDLIEPFMENLHYQPNILSIILKKAESDRKFEDLACKYAEYWNCALSESDIVQLIDSGKVEMLEKYLEYNILSDDNEIKLVRRILKDEENSRGVLNSYLNSLRKDVVSNFRKSPKSEISENAENELIEKCSYDIIKEYCSSVGYLCDSSLIILAKRFMERPDEGLKQIFKNRAILCKEVVNILWV